MGARRRCDRDAALSVEEDLASIRRPLCFRWSFAVRMPRQESPQLCAVRRDDGEVRGALIEFSEELPGRKEDFSVLAWKRSRPR
jgi:hypothetical protein